MKRSVFYAKALAMIAIIVIAAAGCSKEDNNSEAYRTSAGDQATADNLFSDVMNQVELAASQLESELYGSGGLKSTLTGCATITITPWDTVTWPKTITVDFGDVNCEGADGKYRRGLINVTISGRYLDSMTVINILPENYYVNNYKVEGVKTVTNLGHITNGHMTFSILVQDAVITDPDGKAFSWTSSRTRVWVEGEESAWPAVLDDVYEISGEASGTTVDGVNFTIVSLQPLRVERTCEWIVSGQLEITPEGLTPRLLDYGDGTCDDQATVAVNGNSYSITLP